LRLISDAIRNLDTPDGWAEPIDAKVLEAAAIIRKEASEGRDSLLLFYGDPSENFSNETLLWLAVTYLSLYKANGSRNELGRSYTYLKAWWERAGYRPATNPPPTPQVADADAKIQAVRKLALDMLFMTGDSDE